MYTECILTSLLAIQRRRRRIICRWFLEAVVDKQKLRAVAGSAGGPYVFQELTSDLCFDLQPYGMQVQLEVLVDGNPTDRW